MASLPTWFREGELAEAGILALRAASEADGQGAGASAAALPAAPQNGQAAQGAQGAAGALPVLPPGYAAADLQETERDNSVVLILYTCLIILL